MGGSIAYLGKPGLRKADAVPRGNSADAVGCAGGPHPLAHANPRGFAKRHSASASTSSSLRTRGPTRSRAIGGPWLHSTAVDQMLCRSCRWIDTGKLPQPTLRTHEVWCCRGATATVG